MNRPFVLPLCEALECRQLLSGHALPVLSIVATDASAAETLAGQPTDTGTFTIYRKTPAGAAVTTGNLTVKFTRAGTATFGPSGDYTLSANGAALTTTVVIPNGQDHVDILLSPIDDSLFEPTETAVLKLATNAAYSLTATVADRKATVSIADNEPILSIAATDATSAETLPGQSADTGKFTIYRKTPAGASATTGNLTVKFTRAGTARFGPSGDYTLSVDGGNLATTTVVIPNGQDHVDILLSPIDDGIFEPTETAVLTLATTAAYGLTATVADRKATVNIADDTPVITAAVIDAVGSEPGNDPASFQLTRSGYTGNSLTVKISLSGTARNNVDYQAVPLTVTFAQGHATANVVITPKSDNGIPKPTKTVLLKLKTGTGYRVGTTATLGASLQDNLALADYFPTTMGTWWEYTSHVAGRDYDVYRRIPENAPINGYMTTEMQTTLNNTPIATDYVIVNSSGLSVMRESYKVSHGTETQTVATPLLTMPAVLQLGGIYTSHADYTSDRTSGANVSQSTGTATRTLAIAGGVTTVTVPLDTYHAAIEVTLTETWENTDGWHGTTVKHYWVVKGIGVVRTAVSATSADGQNHNQTSASYTASLARWSS